MTSKHTLDDTEMNGAKRVQRFDPTKNYYIFAYVVCDNRDHCGVVVAKRTAQNSEHFDALFDDVDDMEPIDEDTAWKEHGSQLFDCCNWKPVLGIKRPDDCDDFRILSIIYYE